MGKQKETNGGTQLAVISPEAFPVVATGAAMEVIRQNLGGELPSPADFTRIKVPAGGGTTWEIPSVDGDGESTKAVDGIIVYIARRRAYWSNTNPSGEPPQCSSGDCIIGIGDPGGACDECHFNVFGSAHKQDGTAGRGKACKESKLLFILRAGQILPDVVVVPAGSLKAMKSYQLKIGVPYWSLVTRLALEKVQNKDGITFAQIKPSRVGLLDEATAKQVLAYARELKQVFEQTTLDAGDMEDAQD
jgi:hypothetical protein